MMFLSKFLALLVFCTAARADLNAYTVAQLQGFCSIAVGARGCANLANCQATEKGRLIAILQRNFGINDIPLGVFQFIQLTGVTLAQLFGTSPCPRFVNVGCGKQKLRMAYQLYPGPSSSRRNCGRGRGRGHGRGRRCRTATPLVMINGWIGVKEDSQIVAAALSQFRPVLVVDIRGLGQSQPKRLDPSVRYDAHLLASDVASLICKIFRTKVFVSGQSLGGKIALQLSLDFPYLVAGLIPGGTVAGGALAHKNLPGYPTLVTIINSGGYLSNDTATLQALAVVLYDPAFLQRNGGFDAQYLFFQGSFYNRPLSGALALQNIAMGVNYDVSGRVAELNMPVLCLHGVLDAVYNVSSSAALSYAIGSNAQFGPFVNDGHNFWAANPSQYVLYVAQFTAVHSSVNVPDATLKLLGGGC